MPSVRGSRRMQVAALLVASATATGAMAGLAAAAAWRLSTLPPIAFEVLVGAVGVAAAADAVNARSGRFRPLSVRRQVPRAWGRLFDPRTAAALYGGRLGVAPLTHLATWLWWPAALGAASHGIGPSIAFGAWFGAARMVTVVAASRHVEGEMPRRMAALRHRERAVAPVLSACSVAACLVVAGLA